MSWKPSFKLYAENGTTLIYTFEHVQDLPDWPHDEPSYIEYKNLRASGAITVSGGDKSYDFNILGVITASDYQTLITAMKLMQSSIVNNTKYILKLDTSPTTTDEIKVKRLDPIEFRGPERKTTLQYYTVTFKALSW